MTNYIIITPKDKKDVTIRNGRRLYSNINDARLAAVKWLRKYHDMYGINSDISIRKLDPYYTKKGLDAYILVGWVESYGGSNQDPYFKYHSHHKGFRYSNDVTDAYINPATGALIKKGHYFE